MTDEILDPSAEQAVDAAPATEVTAGDGGESAAAAQAPVGEDAAVEPTTAEEPAPAATAEEPAVQDAPEVPEASAPEESPAPAPVDVPVPSPVAAVATPPVSAFAPSAADVSARNEDDARAFERSLGEGGDDYSNTFTSLKEGDVVQGVVVHIDREGVLVDVGTKSEGIIRRHELSRDSSTPAEELVKVGERIDVYVMEAENQDGNLILSKKRADFEKAWERVQEAKEDNRTITAMVTDRVKGGLVVDLGIRGFVPASHVGNGSMKNNLERYVGQSIPLKVIEVDKERRKVVLSNKLAQEEDRQSRKAETVSSLQVGQIRRGIVRRLTNYGAFIDLGGIDGLLHISEMSWTRINHPQEVLKEGQELDVVVLKMDLEAGRVSLGLRQILPDPWTGIDARYHPGDVITGSVTRVVPFGVFVQVEGGIEGIIPNAEMSGRKGGKAPALVQGSEVEVKVIDVRPDERKMTLSLRQARQEEEVKRERKEVEEYQTRSTDREEPRFTIGDALRAKEEAEAMAEGAPEDGADAEDEAAAEVGAEAGGESATETAADGGTAEEAAAEPEATEPEATEPEATDESNASDEAAQE
jgi:predicted RNA-binding protein with RPS1 domain